MWHNTCRMREMTHSHERYDSFICETWLIHMRDMTHLHVRQHMSNMRHDAFTWDITNSHETWLIHMRDMTHSYHKHVSFIWQTWLIQMWVRQYSSHLMTHSYETSLIHMWHVAFAWDMTHLYERHDSCIWKTWLIQMWDNIYVERETWLIDVRHDSFIWETWLIHMTDMTHCEWDNTCCTCPRATTASPHAQTARFQDQRAWFLLPASTALTRPTWPLVHRMRPVAACCSVQCVLQCLFCVAVSVVCCSVLQKFDHLARSTSVFCMMQCVAVCCSALQCVAVCCSVYFDYGVLQCVVLWCVAVLIWFIVCCSVLQSHYTIMRALNWCVLCCSVLHYLCGLLCCSVLQCVAVRCRVTRPSHALCICIELFEYI